MADNVSDMQYTEGQTYEAVPDLLPEQFGVNPAQFAKSVRSFAAAEPERFMEYALVLFAEREFSPALRCVGMTLIQNEQLPRHVLHLIGQPRERVISVVRKVMQCDPLFDVKVLGLLLSGPAKAAVDKSVIAWAIGILDTVSVGMRIVPLMQKLLDEEPDAQIQSKAATFIARRTQNLNWARRQMLESGPRVRANVIDALEGMSSPASRELLWNTAMDSDNRVAGNALLSLYRLGDIAVLPYIFQMARRSEFRFRNTAAWVMGATRDARFAKALAGLLQDPESAVRKNSFRSLQAIKTALVAACAKPELQLFALGCRKEGTADLTVIVQDGAGHPQKQIAPMSWILTDNEIPVNEFSVEAIDGESRLKVAFLASDTTEPRGDFREALEGIRRCLPLRHSGDRWTVLKVRPESMESRAFAYSQSAVLGLKQILKSPSRPASRAPVCFSNSLTDIHGMLAANAWETGDTPAAAFRNGSDEVLVSRELSAGTNQHLICIGIAGLEGLLGSDIVNAASRVAVHVVTLPGTPRNDELRAMAESTGGYFMLAPDVSGIPRCCELVYGALRSGYRLRWQGEHGRISVRLYSEAGHGTVRWPAGPAPL